MKRFADLYAALDDTRATSEKVAIMRRYFAETSPECAAWGLYFLLGNRLKRLIAPTRMLAWIVELSGLPASVIEESYSHVGDLAETLALLLDVQTSAVGGRADSTISLDQCVIELLALQNEEESSQRDYVFGRWQTLPFLQCLLFNKLLTGSLRVGVSAGLAARATCRGSPRRRSGRRRVNASAATFTDDRIRALA